jgi:protein-S-isoprenylcysteine O-methyltransferase Ste14
MTSHTIPVILVAAAVTSFVIYAIAIQRLFSREHGIDRRMRGLQLCGAVFAMIHLWYLSQISGEVIPRSLIGLIFYASGLSVFFAATRALRGYQLTLAFSPDSPRQLIETGIYSRVRHPFYLAYSLTWFAGAIAAPSIATIGTALCMLTFYVVAARLEERKFVASALATTYADYRSRTGLLWPGI